MDHCGHDMIHDIMTWGLLIMSLAGYCNLCHENDTIHCYKVKHKPLIERVISRNEGPGLPDTEYVVMDCLRTWMRNSSL